mgnify:FL=1
MQTALKIYGQCYLVITTKTKHLVYVSVFKTDQNFVGTKLLERGVVFKSEEKFHLGLRRNAIKKNHFIKEKSTEI